MAGKCYKNSDLCHIMEVKNEWASKAKGTIRQDDRGIIV